MNDSGVFVVSLVFTLVVLAALYLWVSFANAAMFRKLGEEGWKAWVPIFNTFVIFQLGNVNVLWAILLFIPGLSIVGFVFAVIAIHNINKRFDRGVGFTVLGAILEPVWASVLAWGSAQAQHASAAPVQVTASFAAPPGTPFGGAFAVGAAGTAGAGADRTGGILPGTGVGLSAGVGPVAPVPSEVPARVPVAGQAGFLDATAGGFPNVAPVGGVQAGAVSAAPAAPIATTPLGDAAQQPPVAAAPVVDPADAAAASVPHDVAEAAKLSYTPPMIAEPAPQAPLAPIEMPEEISVRVSPVHTPTVRPAQPLIDAVPGFDTPRAVQADAAMPFAAAFVPPGASVQAEASSSDSDDFDEDMDATIIAGRRNKAWVFETDAGQRVPLTAGVALLGRNPSASADYPDAQLVTVRDAGRTISKTHARVEFVDNEWIITDLNSTNGVYLVGDDGAETELEVGMAASAGGRFVLGEVAARIFQED